MYKGVQIAVLVVFVVVFGLFTRSQVPISLTEDEILLAIDYAIAETDAVVDETEVLERVKEEVVGQLETRQKRRLKFLTAAYFIIWLIFILYALRLSQTQEQLRRQLDGLQANPPEHKG